MWPQIHRIDLYPAHKAIIFPNTYQLDFIQWTERYPIFEQLEPS